MMSVAARLYVPAPAFLPLPTARPAVRLCAEQWDEERECQEHLQALALWSAAVNELREVLRPEGRAALGGGLGGAASVSEAGLDLWDEELEAMAHLQEMAAWEKEVGKVKAVIETAEARKASTCTAAQLSSCSTGSSDSGGGGGSVVVTEAEAEAEAEAVAEAEAAAEAEAEAADSQLTVVESESEEAAAPREPRAGGISSGREAQGAEAASVGGDAAATATGWVRVRVKVRDRGRDRGRDRDRDRDRVTVTVTVTVSQP